MSKDFEYQLKDYLNGINLKQGTLHDDERAMSKYPTFVVNKCLAGHLDCILHVNQMNLLYELDTDMQYNYYLHSIRKSKRFAPWNKHTAEDDLELVKQFYGYSTDKARDALKLLNNDQLEVIKTKLNVGGNSR